MHVLSQIEAAFVAAIETGAIATTVQTWRTHAWQREELPAVEVASPNDSRIDSTKDHDLRQAQVDVAIRTKHSDTAVDDARVLAAAAVGLVHTDAALAAIADDLALEEESTEVAEADQDVTSIILSFRVSYFATRVNRETINPI